MKVAISLPDPLYKRTDREARRRRVSRSSVVAEALAEYFHGRRGEEITAAINHALASMTKEEKAQDEKDRRWLQAAARQTLSREKW